MAYARRLYGGWSTLFTNIMSGVPPVNSSALANEVRAIFEKLTYGPAPEADNVAQVFVVLNCHFSFGRFRAFLYLLLYPLTYIHYVVTFFPVSKKPSISGSPLKMSCPGPLMYAFSSSISSKGLQAPNLLHGKNCCNVVITSLSRLIFIRTSQ